MADDAGVAQLVEHVIRNDGVVGSSPITGTNSDDTLLKKNGVRYPQSLSNSPLGVCA